MQKISFIEQQFYCEKNYEFILKTGKIRKVNCVGSFSEKDNLTALKEKLIEGNYEANKNLKKY